MAVGHNGRAAASVWSTFGQRGKKKVANEEEERGRDHGGVRARNVHDGEGGREKRRSARSGRGTGRGGAAREPS